MCQLIHFAKNWSDISFRKGGIVHVFGVQVMVLSQHLFRNVEMSRLAFTTGQESERIVKS